MVQEEMHVVEVKEVKALDQVEEYHQNLKEVKHHLQEDYQNGVQDLGIFLSKFLKFGKLS